jgi:hypothetical protein
MIEIFRIRRGQEGALVMVKPPGHLRRIRIFEVHNNVLIPVEQPLFPGMFRLVGHPAELEFRFGIEVFPVETIKDRRGSGAVKASIVKT